MELFKVICVTCRAKLSVRNEALIGQILGCPRCGSMVEVTPPPADSAPIAASAESTINLPAQPAPQPDIVEPTAETVAETAPEIAPEVLAEEAALAEATRAALEASAAVARYKVMVWSMASFFIGAAVVGVVLLRRGDSTAELPTAAPIPTEASQAPSPDEPSPDSNVAAKPAESDVATEKPTAIEPEIDFSEVAEEVVDTTVDTTADTPIDNQETQPVTSTPPPDPVPVRPPAVKVEPAPRLARKFDPLDFDLESFSLDAVDHPSAPAEPEQLAAVEEEVADEVVEAAEEVAPAELSIVERGPADGVETTRRDAAKQLKIAIPAVQLDQVSLADSLRLFSRLSGVPISVAPEQLTMAGITAKKKVSLDATDATLADMLTQVLEPLKLEFATRDEQVTVTRKEATKVREINYPVDDLVSADTSEEELAGWVERLVAPGSWQASGGRGSMTAATGSLRVSQTQRVQYRVLLLLERMRLARGLSPRSRYPAKRLAGAPGTVLLEAELSRSATFTFTHFTAIEEVFDHWQTELGVPLLVDWPALADEGLWPQTTIACSVIDQPWSAALDQVLTPLELGWRASTGGAIEITSKQKAEDELQLEVYSLARDADGDDLVAQLNGLTENQAAEPSGTLLLDAAGSALLSLQPATVQRAIHNHLRNQKLLRD